MHQWLVAITDSTMLVIDAMVLVVIAIDRMMQRRSGPQHCGYSGHVMAPSWWRLLVGGKEVKKADPIIGLDKSAQRSRRVEAQALQRVAALHSAGSRKAQTYFHSVRRGTSQMAASKTT